MLKVKVLSRFRGEAYNTIYETDTIHDMEESRAKSLALRGLVQLVSAVKEEPIVTEETPTEANVETEVQPNEAQPTDEKVEEPIVTEETTTEEVKRKGRPRKTE